MLSFFFDFISFVHLEAMFSFSKSLDNLLGASYLSGAAEAMIKSKSLNSSQLDKNLEELKQVRKSMLKKAESDGYKEPIQQIEKAKQVAHNILKKEITTTPERKNNLFEEMEEHTNAPKNTNTPKNTNAPKNMNAPKNTSSSSIFKNMFGSTNSKDVAKETNVTNVTNVAKDTNVAKETSLMPLNNKSTASTTSLETKNPPPVLQLGGKRRKSRKQKKSRKSRNSKK